MTEYSVVECTVCQTTFKSEWTYSRHRCIGDDENTSSSSTIKSEPTEHDSSSYDDPSTTGYYPSDMAFEEPPDLTINMEGNDAGEEEEEELDPLLLDDDDVALPTPTVKKEEQEEDQRIDDDPDWEEADCDDDLAGVSQEDDDAAPEEEEEEIAGDGESTLPAKWGKTLDIQHPSDTYSCTCKVCGKTFLSKNNFTRHFRAEHTKFRPYDCKVCGKKFLYKHYLNLHMRVHTGEKPYACKLCPKAYCHRTSYTIHMRIHNDIRPYSCSVCGKKCYDRSGLTSHMRSHTKETPYQCETCGRRFTHSKSLLVHTRNHTGEKPYTCSYCGKSFRHWHKHKIHVRLHTGERPYKCKVCGKGFPRSDEVSRHMKSHQGIKSFKCSICGVYCATQASITGHIDLHHSDLRTDEEACPPPEKTLVENGTSGILGTTLPKPLSVYIAKFKNSGMNNAAAAAANHRTAQNDPIVFKTSRSDPKTRVIEITSKDSPMPARAKNPVKPIRKINCVSPKPQISLNTGGRKSMSYQEFLTWQEELLTKQGLIPQGPPTSKKTKRNVRSEAPGSGSIVSAAVKMDVDEDVKVGSSSGGQNGTTITPSSTKPSCSQFVMVSQGGENGTKVILPTTMLSNNNVKLGDSKACNPDSKLCGVPLIFPPSSQKNQPVLLLPKGGNSALSSQPLLIISQGGQKLLFVPPPPPSQPTPPAADNTLGQTTNISTDPLRPAVRIKQEPNPDPIENDKPVNNNAPAGDPLPGGIRIKEELAEESLDSLYPNICIKEEPCD